MGCEHVLVVKKRNFVFLASFPRSQERPKLVSFARVTFGVSLVVHERLSGCCAFKTLDIGVNFISIIHEAGK